MQNFIDAESRNIYLPRWIEPGMSDAFWFSLRSALFRRISSLQLGPPTSRSRLVFCDAFCAMLVSGPNNIARKTSNTTIKSKRLANGENSW
jgi:hypothetical protein